MLLLPGPPEEELVQLVVLGKAASPQNGQLEQRCLAEEVLEEDRTAHAR